MDLKEGTTAVPASENMDGHWIIRFDYSGALHHIFNGQSGMCAFWDAVVAFWALKKRHECWINTELPILLLHFTDKPSESSKTSTIFPSSLSFMAVACAFPPTNSECSCLSLVEDSDCDFIRSTPESISNNIILVFNEVTSF